MQSVVTVATLSLLALGGAIYVPQSWQGLSGRSQPSVSGRVLDQASGQPIEDATVQVATTGGKTNLEGYFFVRARTEHVDLVRLTISAPDYIGITALIEAGDSQIRLADILLVPRVSRYVGAEFTECEIGKNPDSTGVWVVECDPDDASR